MKIDGIDLSDLSKFPTTITMGELKKLREKAEKWDRVKEIADSRPPCKCPLWDAETAECTSEHAGCIFDDVVDALSKEPT